MDRSDRRKHRVTIWAYILYCVLGFSALLLALIGEGESEVILSLAFFTLSVLLVAPIALVLTILRQFWGIERRLLALLFLTLALAVPLWLSMTSMFPHEYMPSWYTQSLINVGLGLYGVVVAVLVTWHFVMGIWRSQ
jgi:hypothetical protein